MTVLRAVFDAALARNLTLTTAESCTGGMISAAITDIAGSSAIFTHGFVTYSNAAKVELLRVRPETLEAHGAVSEEVAREMAAGARNRSGADLAISVTGIAGPGGSDHKPEGRVCFGLNFGQETRTETQEFGAIGRHNVRIATRDHALQMILTALQS